MSDFIVVAGPDIADILRGDKAEVRDIVASTYRLHDAGDTINPDSYFLRFPHKPDSRVIALPAYIGAGVNRMGIKWISSFPDNLSRGIPRASAVLILNDFETGRPLACLESAHISAARTAASAAVAAEQLCRGTGITVGVVGTGVIASTVLDHLHSSTVDIADVVAHDLDHERVTGFAEQVRAEIGLDVAPVGLNTALKADLVVFATTAGEPYVAADHRFAPGQVVLNISLRDLPPEVILASTNLVDDVEHCLKANTSPHLAEQATGSREFIHGTLGGLLNGTVALPDGKPVVFSPFGLGVLDIAVGSHVMDRALETGKATVINRFIG
ncbi:2,3-diaminopropionate biosynthesis protein SbnB [Kitasatospora sp. NPDC058162]|uniref:2,3-diaminopropionate biosynthesis protein SbnB n=1 Tax=Kitasatospora sp. NPDC058162 TaxID=3346362 RepID=UPI0036DCBB67